MGDMETKKTRTEKRQMRTTSKILLGFLAAILIGAVLLSLPAATVSGTPDFLTALFTATTSVCVTGLVVVPTFSYWTMFGKVVILILIQLGGLGIVVLTSVVMLALNRKFSLRDRMMIQDSFGLNSMRGMVVFVKKVIKGTLLIETIGACLYMIAFIPRYGVARGIWFSVFHAVSAFCNAGIDILGTDSLMSFSGSPLVLLTSAFLIVSGGIGFVVWWDFADVFRKVKNGELKWRQIGKNLKTHTKLVLIMTLSLLVSGMIFTLLFEYQNPQTLGSLSFGEKLLNAFFQSVTLRTAGFASVSQSGLTDSSVLVSLIYMIIGGSPVGTAGGIKTVTAAVLLLTVKSVVQGRNETVVFKKTVNPFLIRRSLAVVVISGLVFLLCTVLLIVSNRLSLADGSFEVASAIATVGLSRDVTPSLNTFGRILIMLCMYLGRVGPITMFIFFGQRAGSKKSVHYSEAELIVS